MCQTNHKKIVVLDRDGVINEDSDAYIRTVEEFQPIPGSLEAIARLKYAGFLVAIATNQSGVGRGYFSESELHAMHEKLSALLAPMDAYIDTIVYCPHVPDENCDCRKPKAGLLEQIENNLSVDLNGSWIIGDSLRDLQAGVLKSMQPVLVRTGKGELVEKNETLPAFTKIYDTLYDAVSGLLGEKGDLF